MTAFPAAPRGLSPAQRRVWHDTVRVYELEVAELRLLEAFCRALDRAAELRAVVAEQGVSYLDRFDQPRMHPALSEERSQRDQARRLWTALALDGGPTPEARPPRRSRGGRG